jgi:hypothetical protein
MARGFRPRIGNTTTMRTIIDGEMLKSHRPWDRFNGGNRIHRLGKGAEDQMERIEVVASPAWGWITVDSAAELFHSHLTVVASMFLSMASFCSLREEQKDH